MEPTLNPTSRPTLRPTSGNIFTFPPTSGNVFTFPPTIRPTSRPTQGSIDPCLEVTETISVNTTIAPNVITTCFDVPGCINPTILVDYLPIDYDFGNEFILINDSITSFDCASGVPVNCFITEQCGPFSITSTSNNQICFDIVIGPQVDALCFFAAGVPSVLDANVTLLCDKCQRTTTKPMQTKIKKKKRKGSVNIYNEYNIYGDNNKIENNNHFNNEYSNGDNGVYIDDQFNGAYAHTAFGKAKHDIKLILKGDKGTGSQMGLITLFILIVIITIACGYYVIKCLYNKYYVSEHKYEAIDQYTSSAITSTDLDAFSSN